ncbi:NAD(+) diphosphatase [Nocardioides sp. Root151]|uniref:NAD(+) diphosphatase n=1 Tax=Nocardioides sp. Root151 TaxID=1736475 RepID=UPI00070373DD|nr:NAD(+) diphosphatase [Nocardioides sp. Root151]KQZ74978.1 NADH pyrophosphatase [Nocardioides sp. Root151]
MTYPHAELAAGAHARMAERRDDDAWLAEKWADPKTRVLLVAGTRLRSAGAGPSWVSPEEAPDGTRILLGEHAGRAHFAMLIDPEHALGEREEWVGLRALAPHFMDHDSSEAPLAFHAIGLAEWHWRTRHCPVCGGRLESRQSGHLLACTECEREQFPRTDPAVIMVVAIGEPGSDDERCLLGRGAGWGEGRFSTLAGFVEPGESLEDAVRREVFEEVGVEVGQVDYFGNQPWPLPTSLMLGFVGRATTTDIVLDGDEMAEARWFTRAEMRAEAEAGTIVLPGGISISRSLVEHWYGGPLPGRW